MNIPAWEEWEYMSFDQRRKIQADYLERHGVKEGHIYEISVRLLNQQMIPVVVGFCRKMDDDFRAFGKIFEFDLRTWTDSSSASSGIPFASHGGYGMDEYWTPDIRNATTDGFYKFKELIPEDLPLYISWQMTPFGERYLKELEA